jgi:hypothetical protein
MLLKYGMLYKKYFKIKKYYDKMILENNNGGLLWHLI